MIRRILLLALTVSLVGGAAIGCHSHNKPYLLPHHRL